MEHPLSFIYNTSCFRPNRSIEAAVDEIHNNKKSIIKNIAYDDVIKMLIYYCMYSMYIGSSILWNTDDDIVSDNISFYLRKIDWIKQVDKKSFSTKNNSFFKLCNKTRGYNDIVILDVYGKTYRDIKRMLQEYKESKIVIYNCYAPMNASFDTDMLLRLADINDLSIINL